MYLKELRALYLLEYSRQALQERQEKLSNIYKRNPKRATTRPTTEMILDTFREI